MLQQAPRHHSGRGVLRAQLRQWVSAHRWARSIGLRSVKTILAKCHNLLAEYSIPVPTILSNLLAAALGIALHHALTQDIDYSWPFDSRPVGRPTARLFGLVQARPGTSVGPCLGRSLSHGPAWPGTINRQPDRGTRAGPSREAC